MSGDNSQYQQLPVTDMSRDVVNLAVETMSNSLPFIFKMNVDCFEELFEWLSLRDLKTLRQTCIRMKQVVDYYIKMNFPVTLQKVWIFHRQDKFFASTETESVGFELVNHINFWDHDLTLAPIDKIKSILVHTEKVRVCCSLFKFDLYDSLLQHCPQLKQFMIEGCAIEMGQKWLHQCYPTLEHLGMYGVNKGSQIECTDLEILFEQNPNIQHFTVSEKVIWDNRNWIRKSNIQIDRLDIFYAGSMNSSIIVDEFIVLMNELHAQGFYKRIHLYLQLKGNEFLRSLLSLCALEALFGYDVELFLLPCLTNLKELDIKQCKDIEIAKTLATNLPNLHRISMEEATLHGILPFIHQCQKLSQIRIDSFSRSKDNGIFFISNIINLPAINKQRAKLLNAQKLLIFVREHIFLKNKRKQRINLDLVELKRIYSWRNTNPFHTLL